MKMKISLIWEECQTRGHDSVTWQAGRPAMFADLDMMRVNIRSLFDLVEVFGYIK